MVTSLLLEWVSVILFRIHFCSIVCTYIFSTKTMLFTGMTPCVVLTSPDVIREAMITKGNDFAGRAVTKSCTYHEQRTKKLSNF